MEKKKPQQLYLKMFRTYTAMVLCIVAVLVIYFISASKNRLLESEREETERISGEALYYLDEISQIADFLHRDLYRSSTELEDLLQYFRMKPEEYQKYVLGRYISSEELIYKGTFYFMNEAFEAYPQLEKIELISYENSLLTECRPEKIVYPGKEGKSRLAQIRDLDYCDPGKLAFMKEVRELNTMEPVGCILFTFEAEQALKKIRRSVPQAEMTVIFGDDKVVFQEPDAQNDAWMNRDKQYFVCNESVGEYQIRTSLDERQASRLPWARFLAILAVGVAAGGIGIFYVDHYARHFAGRVDSILSAMNKVTTGDFRVRLETEKKEDELDMIAENFNGMCEKLELYIEKSYLEEIERKNAQMQALQSQINPHFLYNTLEAIRMKAICNGDKEVGKMLYSMVVLFRSQLKEADVITLEQELDYCRQYMELFEYRFQGCFRSEVECPPDLLSVPIIKFVLQPVMENYFIHGIERERQDNLVQIRAEKKGDTLFLYVKDNGRGMEMEKLKQKNKELRENVKTKKQNESIGIQNVNRRLKAVYGEKYGIRLEPVQPKGLTVVLMVGVEEEKDSGAGDQSEEEQEGGADVRSGGRE